MLGTSFFKLMSLSSSVGCCWAEHRLTARITDAARRRCILNSDHCSITNIEKEPSITGPLLPPAGTGPNFAEGTYKRWFVGSRPILRDPGGVLMVWATRYLSA